MKVLHVVPSIARNRGGPARSVPQLVESLRRLGVQTTLAAADGGSGAEVGLTHLRGPGEIPDRSSRHRLEAAITGVDLVEIHSFWNGTVSITAGICRRLGVPYVLAPRGMLDPFCLRTRRFAKRFYYRLIDHRTIDGAGGFHFLSSDERARAQYLGAVRDEQIAVSPNGAPEVPEALPGNAMDRLFPETTGRRRLLHLGRLDSIKGIDLQIDAVSRIPAAERPVLLLVGPDFGEAPRLRSLVNKSGLDEWVRFVEPIDGVERLALLRDADAVLLTSEYDCNPVVATETMKVGGAMVATSTCGLGAPAAAGAVRVVPRDAAEMARVIRHLLADERQNSSLRERALAYAAESLPWTQVLRPLVGLYDRIAAGRAAGAGKGSA